MPDCCCGKRHRRHHIISALNSTRNGIGKRDPELHQTK